MRAWWMLMLGAALLVGCAKPACDPDVDDCSDGGGPPPDVCNSRDEALTDPQCALVPGDGVGRQGYIGVGADGGVDQDWYVVQLPALTGRSLVHVTAGYAAPSTPVNLAVSVLKEDGATSLARKIDHHGAAAPRPVDIIFPYAESNARLLVLLADEAATGKPNLDVRNPYSVKVEVLDNPDPNEPNDTTPTDIPLTAGGPGLVGQGVGALATDDDVDRFTFTAPAGRKILYLHITGACPTLTSTVCDTRLMPAPPMRVAYTLYDPTMKPVSEGQAQNEFIPVDLATARLLVAGQYTLVISGYKPPNVTAVTPGDLRMIYHVDLEVMDDLDANEPNDTLGAPTVVKSLAYGASASVTGRLSYVPDPDVFPFDLAPSASAGVLRYRLTLSAAPGRFAPLTLASDRQLRVVTQVTNGATAGDRQTACISDATVCPKGYEGSVQAQGLVEGLCQSQDPPWCLWSERNEDPLFTNLKNMEGAIPVVAHGSPARVFIFVQDDGNNYADDREYTLEVSYDADPDDTARASMLNQTQTAALVENASFPTPVTVGEVTGSLTHGYGRVFNNQIDQGEGVRAANDYDAVPTDTDRFEFTLPAVSLPADRSWALEWEISHNDAGSPPGDLALEVGFCTGPTTADGGCGAVERVLAWSGDRIQPWYGQGLSSREVLWSKQVNANSTIVTAQPVGCFCFEPRFLAAGHLVFKVAGVDRMRNDPINYRVRQSVAPYPPSYVVDGGTLSCPVATDGGASCQFTNMP